MGRGLRSPFGQNAWVVNAWGYRGVSKQTRGFEPDQDARNVEGRARTTPETHEDAILQGRIATYPRSRL